MISLAAAEEDFRRQLHCVHSIGSSLSAASTAFVNVTTGVLFKRCTDYQEAGMTRSNLRRAILLYYFLLCATRRKTSGDSTPHVKSIQCSLLALTLQQLCCSSAALITRREYDKIYSEAVHSLCSHRFSI